MEKLCVDYIRIDGSTRKDLRSTYIDRFQLKENCKVAVLSLKGSFNFYQQFCHKYFKWNILYLQHVMRQ